jgi:hypothetical protein
MWSEPLRKKAYDKEWKKSPEYARQQAYAKKYRAKPEVAAARLEYKRMKYKTDPVVREAYKKRARDYTRNIANKIAPEVRAEKILADAVKLMGGMCPKFVDPGRRGAPDRMVMLPGKPVTFVEMKREKLGKLSPWQERYHADLRALGHKVFVLWNEKDVNDFLAST